MKNLFKLIIIAMVLGLGLTSCTCGDCQQKQQVEREVKKPTSMTHYRLYLSESNNYRDVRRFTYDVPEGTLVMYRTSDATVSIYVIPAQGTIARTEGTTDTRTETEYVPGNPEDILAVDDDEYESLYDF